MTTAENKTQDIDEFGVEIAPGVAPDADADVVINEAESETSTAPATRKQIRDALLGKRHEAATECFTLFDIEIELHQPSFESMLDARDEDSMKKRMIDMIIKYAYVPGTNDPVFEPADEAVILSWPFGKDLFQLQLAITKMTGIDIGEAEEDLRADPLDD